MKATTSETLCEQVLVSALGPIRVRASERGVREIRVGTPAGPRRVPRANGKTNGLHASRLSRRWAEAAVKQLEEYFAGRRTRFTVPLDLRGTPFQEKVWQALCEIPCGETRSYAEIACRIGQPRAARAVGMANHNNPIPILVPCHRVIAADGSLGGYAGGLRNKRLLLELEGSQQNHSPARATRRRTNGRASHQ